MPRPPAPSWPLAIVLGIAAILLAGAAVLLARTLLLMATTSVTQGSYVGSVAQVGGNHGGTFLYPRFAYRTEPGGPLRTVTATSGSTAQPDADGDLVAVRFDPRHPDDAVVASFWTLWLAPTFFAVLGLAFAVPPLLILAFRRRR